jgi:DNA-binding beta-propeller fold protein YncE
LFEGERGGPCGVALDPAAGKVYWTNFFSGEIRVANLDASGTASSLFTEASEHVCGVALDRAAGKIYWANYSANSIRVANLDGTGGAATLVPPTRGLGRGSTTAAGKKKDTRW